MAIGAWGPNVKARPQPPSPQVFAGVAVRGADGCADRGGAGGVGAAGNTVGMSLCFSSSNYLEQTYSLKPSASICDCSSSQANMLLFQVCPDAQLVQWASMPEGEYRAFTVGSLFGRDRLECVLSALTSSTWLLESRVGTEKLLHLH